jgi:hypothetical protein
MDHKTWRQHFHCGNGRDRKTENAELDDIIAPFTAEHDAPVAKTREEGVTMRSSAHESAPDA